MSAPLAGIYIPKRLATDAAEYDRAWVSGRVAEVRPGFVGDATLWVAVIKGKGDRRSFAGYARIRAWVSMPPGAKMAVYVPSGVPPKPVRFKPSLRFIGIEVR